VFATTDWELHFPLSSMQALPRVVSDHTPLLLDTGNNLNPPKNSTGLRSGGAVYLILQGWFLQFGSPLLLALLQLTYANSNLDYLGRKPKGGVLILKLLLKRKRRTSFKNLTS
jgi:hypothetical protein